MFVYHWRESQFRTLFFCIIVDSGGQYENGCTTDVTRTFHFGDPEPEQIEMYTRVLMGAIDLVKPYRDQYSNNF